MRTTPMRTIVAALAASALAAGSTIALGSAASAASRVQVNDCGELSAKPADLVLACADANTMLTEMTWTGWSNKRAVGKGVYEANDCTPTCVAGTFRSYPARIQLTTPRVQSGTRVFTKAIITFTKTKPGKAKKISVRLAPYSPAVEVAPTPDSSAAPVEPTPTPAASPSASASPTATPTPSASPSASPSVTPTPTASVTQAAVVAPVVNVTKLDKVSSKLRVNITASVAGVGGYKRGIKSVTVYRPNEYNAELTYKASYIGEDTAAQNEWSALLPCDSSGRDKDTLRIVAVADNGESSTIRVAQTVAGC